MSEINQICEKVIIIDKGKIIAIDTPKNLEEKIKNNVINLIVEDSKNWMGNIKEKIPEIIDIKLLSENGKEKSYENYKKILEDVDGNSRFVFKK